MSDAFFQAYKSISLEDVSDPVYRLYYDPLSGEPIFYSMQDEPGTYIEVDAKTYSIGNYNCVVENGKLKNLNIQGKYFKLVPGNAGTTTHIDNVMIIAEKGQKWSLKNYED